MECQITVRYKLSEEVEQRMCKKFWEEMSKKLPDSYILKPKFKIFSHVIDYHFMNIYRKGLKAKLGIAKPIMTLYMDANSKYFHVDCFDELLLHIIEPIIQTLKKLGYYVVITKFIKKELETERWLKGV